ncbi:MAG: pyridoxal-phosphate dependent enzyme, partial [Egibacteraceae bacterium]
PWNRPPETVAQSIADPLTAYPAHGTHTLRLVRRHGGAVLAVDDAAITDALDDLGRAEGIVCEPAAATGLAALRALPELPRPVVLMISGHGLKDPAGLLRRGATRLLRLAADADAEEVAALLTRA